MKGSRPQERPPGFTYRPLTQVVGDRDRELHADSVGVEGLARKFGTPLYLYSASTIRQRYRQFDEAFGRSEHIVCYSVKANSTLSILRLLAGLGAGFDVVSGGELQRVTAARRKSRAQVVFSGVGKLDQEIDMALHAGILLFNVESASELAILSARATHLKKRANFAVRVNPDVDAKTHPYVSTGLHRHKFGVPLGDAARLYRDGAANRQLRAAGVSTHIGSQILDVQPFGEAMERIACFVRTLRSEGHNIRYVDAGGGLGIPYSHDAGENFQVLVQHYARNVLKPLNRLGVCLLLEPGRSLIGPAGVLITRVLYRKRNDGKRFLIVDAAMNDLLRPSLYAAHHEIVPCLLRPHTAVETVDVVGPICETGDFFACNRTLPVMEERELLAILDAGAYGMALASNYNSRPRAAEVLVDGTRPRLIRERETMQDLLRPERVQGLPAPTFGTKERKTGHKRPPL